MNSRFTSLLACLGCAVALSTGAAAQSSADPVARFAGIDWRVFTLESCDPTEADLRIVVSVRTDWLGREVLELPMRKVPRNKAADSGAISIDPIAIVGSGPDGRGAVAVQLGNASRRGFDLRVIAREGGQEMARPRLDTVVSCRWRDRQRVAGEGVEVNVVIVPGPAPESDAAE
jgi:hypothetical protein